MPEAIQLAGDALERALALYDKGFPPRRVAELMGGLSPTIIHRAILESGRSLRKSHHVLRKDERNRQIVALAAKGYSYAQIAEKFGVSKQRVHFIVSRGH